MEEQQETSWVLRTFALALAFCMCLFKDVLCHNVVKFQFSVVFLLSGKFGFVLCGVFGVFFLLFSKN